MDIWYFYNKDMPDDTMDRLIRGLPHAMASEIDEYKFIKDKKARLISRLLVKEYCAKNRYPNIWWHWEKNQYHKPYIENGPFFNISYSDEMVVVAFDRDCEIGIDLERTKDINIEEIFSFFHPDEINYLNNSDLNVDMFYTIWTKKEALLKATGKGISQDLDKYSVLSETIFLENKWTFKDVRIDEDHKCTLCFSNENSKIITERITSFKMPSE